MGYYDFFAHKKVSGISRMIGAGILKHHVALLKKNMTETASLLVEIGTGSGQFAVECKNHLDVKYIGYEPNQPMREMNQRKGLDIHAQTVPPFFEDDASVDAVVMLNVFEHFPDVSTAMEVLSETFRVLRTGGVVLITAPSMLDLGADFYNYDFTHALPTTEIRLSQMLHDSGFTDIRVSTFFGNVFNDYAGRFVNFSVRTISHVIAFFLPRSISRSEKYQKMRILFCPNLLALARK